MKLSFNKYWIFMAICIIGNIFIFMLFSNKLEKYVVTDMVAKQEAALGI